MIGLKELDVIPTALLRKLATDFGIKVADSISARPEEWQLAPWGFRLEHATLSVWVANRAYGLHVEFKPENGLPPSDIEFRPTWADRHLIWRAVKTLRLPTPRQIRQREAEKVFRRGAA